MAEQEHTQLETWCRKRIHNCAKRLQKLIELNAPACVIGNEIGMLMQRGAALCGNSVMDFPANSMARFERWRLGFCMHEGCGKKLQGDLELTEGMCEQHIEETKEEYGDNYTPRLGLHNPDEEEGHDTTT